jgi:hypothetical protein
MKRVRIADLQKMPAAERDAELRSLTARTPLNGELKSLDLEISEFEHKFSMSSADLLAKLEQHRIRETTEIASWLGLIRLRAHLVSPR